MYTSADEGRSYTLLPAMDGFEVHHGDLSLVPGAARSGLLFTGNPFPPFDPDARPGGSPLAVPLWTISPPAAGRQMSGRASGNATFVGLPGSDSVSRCNPAGTPLMHTIATRFTRLRSGRLVSVFVGTLLSGPTTCGNLTATGCCPSAHFFDSADGRSWHYLGSFRGGGLEWMMTLCADGICSTPVGPGESNTVVELADGRLMSVFRVSSCGIPLVKTNSSECAGPHARAPLPMGHTEFVFQWSSITH